MTAAADIAKKIRLYSENCQKIEKQRANESSVTINHEKHSRHLDKVLHDLQRQVEQHEFALRELRASKDPLDLPQPNLTPTARLVQTRRATQAYKSLSQTTPDLPAPDSPLNGLLALRETSRLIKELKTNIPITARDLAASRDRLKTEETNLRDANVIKTGLAERIKILTELKQDREEAQRGKKKKEDPNQRGKELINLQREKKVGLERKTAKLDEAIKEFVDDYLAPMLAAEDLGGPVVGDQTEVSDATLEAGYTARGKEKKSTKPNGNKSGGPRQQRIDELVHRQRAGQGENNDPSSTRFTNRREAAAAEMHALIDSLLNVANTSAYVDLDQDSAASRFLVKAKIAQFHPRDSRKLRLIDVAREIAN